MEVKFEELKGKVFTNIERINDYGRDVLIFTCDDGVKYQMHHSQDCCESVYIDDICGDLTDLLNSEILLAEEVIHKDENPEGFVKEYQDYFTWTFYKLATIKGYVDIRWYGESNGYYSESVDLCKIDV